jgi:hypothetical protein
MGVRADEREGHGGAAQDPSPQSGRAWAEPCWGSSELVGEWGCWGGFVRPWEP